MAFTPKKQAFNASINAVTLGTGDKSIVIGGENVLPFYTFDAPMANNAPKIARRDHGHSAWKAYTAPGLQEFYAGCETVVDMAKRAETMEGAFFICLHLEGADPNGENRSVEECVALAKAVADAVSHAASSSWAARMSKRTLSSSPRSPRRWQGKNILVLSAREENYKTVGASAGLGLQPEGRRGVRGRYQPGQAAQRTVMTQLGVPAASICHEPGLRRSRLWLSNIVVLYAGPREGCGSGSRTTRSCRCPS